jgi:hypothetical protein
MCSKKIFEILNKCLNEIIIQVLQFKKKYFKKSSFEKK